jgi:hypothetical protein
MAYDSARGVTVMFGGGLSGIFNNETWEWNGVTWTQRLVAGPPPRAIHAMVYDAARHVTVVFGGLTSTTTMSDETWEWDGNAWTQRLVTGPSPRFFHAMAYDSDRRVTVLFGGATSSNPPIFSGQTWELDGIAWTQRPVGAPLPRLGHAMAFDTVRHVSVLFGGQTSTSSYSDETWEWNGTGWAQQFITGPSPRALSGMVYDAARAQAVLFSGYGGTTFDETWTLGLACYANCDGSTAQPALNVHDFACFLNRFAVGEPYANCDHSTTPPTLNVLDFTCFLNAFATGCP